MNDSHGNLTLRDGIDVFRHRWPGIVSPSQESPVFLMAAGWRTGSTLLQRMLSQDCLMWGEPYGQGGLIDSAADLLRRIKDFWPDESFFFRGQKPESRTTEFIANLYPPPVTLLNSYVRFFEGLFSEPAKSAGVERWGVKTVRLSADHAYFFRWLFPQAKFLFLTRDPYQAFRSYYTISKRRSVQWFDRWPDRPVTTERFARHWAALTGSFLEHCDELGAKFLRYEDLIAGDADLSGIERYLGVRLAGEARASNPGAFPLPDDRLAESEYEIVAGEVEPLARSLGYVREQREHPSSPTTSVDGDRPAADVEQTYRDAVRAHQQGDLAAAEKAYSRILEQKPDHAGAWHFLGVVRLAQGDRASAREHIERALALCDTKPVYWNNYGAVLKETGEYRQAEAALHRALDLNKNYADAWTNLGHTQEMLHLAPNQVERSYRNALELAPSHVDATFRLADFHHSIGRHAEAVEGYRRGVQLAPNRPDATRRLANALMSAKQWQEAEQVVESQIAREPDNPEHYLAMARVQAGLECVEGAKRAYRRSVSLGARPPIWNWKHLGVCPTIFPDDDNVEEYWDCLKAGLAESLEARMYLDWRSLPQDGYTPSFNLPHHGRCCRDVREMFSARFESAFPQPQFERPKGRRLHVGFLITAGHEPGFLRGMSRILAGLNSQIEVSVFCSGRAIERFRAAIPRDDVRYVPLADRFDRSVELVRSARCDVLYLWKVGPDPWSYFLSMARLAPVQCTSSGCHGTSGVRSVDYYLSCPWMESPNGGVDAREHYTENLFLLDTFPMFQSRQPHPEGVLRTEFDLPEEGALYFCPHRLAKYCPAFDFYLRDILENDPKGYVVLLAGSDECARKTLESRMRQNLGDGCFQRVRFQPAMAVNRYYRLFRAATLVLDTPVYASSLTAYDAFSAGVPLLTQSGPLAVQNYATGLYRCMGMVDELVAQDRDDYVAKALAIGTEPERAEYLKRMLAERDGIVFDDSRVIGEYERFFSTVTSCHG